MQFVMSEIVKKPFLPRETVVLHFNKRDAQIARNWSKSSAVRDIFDDKN